jgi:succinylglutamate desuccinylase
MLRKNKKILFIYRTHGNESVGERALKKFEHGENPVSSKIKYDTVVGNPAARKKNVRFTDCDLNRSAPGSKNSDLYEERRAWEILKIAGDYDSIIDLHGTAAHSGIFTIVTNPTRRNLEFARTLPVPKIVIWKSSTPSKTGPLTRFVDCGVEIECGPQNSKVVVADLAAILRKIIDQGLKGATSPSKKIFVVYGKIIREEYGKRKPIWHDFQKAKYRGEEFYPLLVGQYKKYICYKMKILKKA